VVDERLRHYRKPTQRIAEIRLTHIFPSRICSSFTTTSSLIKQLTVKDWDFLYVGNADVGHSDDNCLTIDIGVLP
jgi:hypothetical protein